MVPVVFQTVYATLILKDVTLRINSNQPTSENLVVCDAYIYNLKGQVCNLYLVYIFVNIFYFNT